MLDDGTPEYVPDRLYERLFQPWTLPESEWPLCQEDWARVDAITSLNWAGHLVDFGAGDGTLAAMVCSRNPLVKSVFAIEQDPSQVLKGSGKWSVPPPPLEWPIYWANSFPIDDVEFDGALCCEVLEHLTHEDGVKTLIRLRMSMVKDALLCVTVPDMRGTRAEYPGHITKYDWPRLERTIKRAGFVGCDVWHEEGCEPWIMATAYA